VIVSGHSTAGLGFYRDGLGRSCRSGHAPFSTFAALLLYLANERHIPHGPEPWHRCASPSGPAPFES